jgi:hypothetical protein
MHIKAFTPNGNTVNIDVAATTAQVKIDDANGDIDVLIRNDGTATAWIKFGATGVEAALATSIPVGAGVETVLHAPVVGSDLYVAAIAAGATGKIYFTPGAGI